MTDTPTSADVAGMTNEEAACMIEYYETTTGGGDWSGKMGQAHRLAIAALRSALPAPEVPDKSFSDRLLNSNLDSIECERLGGDV